MPNPTSFSSFTDKATDVESGTVNDNDVQSLDKTINDPRLSLSRQDHRTVQAPNANTSRMASFASAFRPKRADAADVVPGDFRTLSIQVTETRSTRNAVVDTDKKRKKNIKELVELDWHTLSIDQVLNRFSTSIQSGLAPAQVQRRLSSDGPNVIPPPPAKWHKMIFNAIFGGFGSLLLGGSIICFVAWRPLGDPNPSAANLALAVVILIVTTIQAVFNGWQDFTTSRIMKSIKDMLPSLSWVKRDNKFQEVQVSDLVAGDVFTFSMGTKVPADARIVEASDDLSFDRSILTGESDPVPAIIEENKTDIFMESPNIALQGTLCVSGKGTGVVVGTGAKTVFARIASMASHGDKKRTTLETEVFRFVTLIASFAAFTSIIIIILWAAWLRRDHPDFINVPTLLINVVSVAIAFIPEGLPVAVTLTLTVIAKKMKDNKILCKSLSTVETLGAINVLMSDKTGTLTTNNMVATEITLLDNSQINRHSVDDMFDDNKINYSAGFYELLTVSSICNDAQIEYSNNEKNTKEIAGINGDASDTALVRLVEKFQEIQDIRQSWSIVGSLPFNSKNKFSVKLACRKFKNQKHDDNFVLMCKGAPDVLIQRCGSIMDAQGASVELTPEIKTKLLQAQQDMASSGQRVLILTAKVLSKDETRKLCLNDGDNTSIPIIKSLNEENYISMLQDVCIIGLVGIVDPPRPESKNTVKQCRAAGIRFMMVTGDFPATGLAIARSIGIITNPPDNVHTLYNIKEDIDLPESNEEGQEEGQVEEHDLARPSTSIVISGSDLMAMDDDELKIVTRYDEVVFARMSPEQKLRVVKNLQNAGYCVGMTGDGVNDAPSLKQADIGIAMGNGSAVAMESANLVLMDNLSAILKGIELGRLVFDNLRKVIVYLLPAGSWSELWPVVVSVVFGLPQALSSLQMIIICVGTDIFPALSLIYEEAEENLLKRKPRNIKKDRLANWKLLVHSYFGIGIIETTLSMIGAFYFGFERRGVKFSQIWLSYGNVEGVDAQVLQEATNVAQSIYFTNLVIMQWGNLLSTRTRRLSIFQQSPLKNYRLLIAMPLALCIAIFFCYVPFFQKTFLTHGVPVYIYFLALAYAIALLFLDEMRKYFVRRSSKGLLARIAW